SGELAEARAQRARGARTRRAVLEMGLERVPVADRDLAVDLTTDELARLGAVEGLVAGLELLAEARPGPGAQCLDADGRQAPEPADLAGGAAGEVAEDQRRPLVRQHPRERADDVVRARQVAVRRRRQLVGIELDLVWPAGDGPLAAPADVARD